MSSEDKKKQSDEDAKGDGEHSDLPSSISEKTCAKKDVSSAKRRFTRLCNRLRQGYNDQEENSLLSNILVDIEDAYASAEKKFECYSRFLESDDDEDQKSITDYQNKLDGMYNEVCKLRKMLKSSLDLGTTKSPEQAKSSHPDNPKCENPGAPDLQKEVTSKTLTGSTSIQTKPSAMKVKKLDNPSFGGDIRCYPTFRRDYERHMVPVYGNDAFALRSVLNGEALKTIKGVDDDYDEMFKRLDQKYGRPEKINDAILEQLKSLQAVKDGDIY